eukprot:792483-Pelagomonas_calceolata.AAC.1
MTSTTNNPKIILNKRKGKGPDSGQLILMCTWMRSNGWCRARSLEHALVVRFRLSSPRSSSVQQRAAGAAAWGLVWASRGLRNAAGPVAGGVHGTLVEWCSQRLRGAKHRAEAWEAWLI